MNLLKEHRDEGFFAEKVFRVASKPFVWLFAKTSLSPNAITLISLVIGLLGAHFIASANDGLCQIASAYDLAKMSCPSSSILLLAGVLIFFSYVIDNVDGEIARLKGLGSKRGRLLDATCDRIKEFSWFAALGYLTGQWFLALAGLFAVLTTCLTTEMIGKIDDTIMKKTQSSSGKILGIKQSYFTSGIDFQCMLLTVGCITGLLYQTLLYFAVIQNIYWILIFLLIFRRMK